MKFAHRFNLVLAAMLCLIAPQRINAQFVQQGSKLIGSGAVGVAWQGRSVSLSADGNTALVGGDNDNSNTGAAWVWTRTGGVWTQQGSKLVGSGAVGPAYQGWSASLSGDGNTAIIGGYTDNSGAGTGAAWVWIRSGGVWTQQGGKLVGSDAASNNSRQGWSVSLSYDGNTAIIGGPADYSDNGAAWVWTRAGGVWTQQGSKLVGSGAAGAFQGRSVSLSGDGNTALVGGDNDNGGAGAAWVWTRSGGVWTQQGGKLVGSGAISAVQGASVSLSSDGNTVISGGYGDSSFTGAAWVFTRNGVSVLPQGSAVQLLNLENGKFMGFDLPQKEHVTIRIFNSQGRMISQLLDETRDAGYYSVPLSGKAHGSYYLDFRAGDFHSTMRIEH